MEVENGQANKRFKIDWMCVNPNCTKGKGDTVVTARPFVVSYFGAKHDDKRKRKVCKDCLSEADSTLEAITESVKNGDNIHHIPLPKIREAAVVLDDSDEDDEARTDESSESDIEVEVGETESLESLVAEAMQNLNIPNQIDNMISDVSTRLDALNEDKDDINATFAELEKQVDAMRSALYAPFKPVLQHIDPISINDVASESSSSSTSGSTSANTSDLPALPPNGILKRPNLKVGEKVLAMKGKDILSVWDEAIVSDVSNDAAENPLPYKVRFDHWVNGTRRSAFYKKLGLKNIAYNSPATVKLQVGTRIIAVYVDPDAPDEAKPDFYSGIIAEPPKNMNKNRYLVFFDDGYASYVCHKDIRVVCSQTESAVWEDIHPNSRAFVKQYLQQYPERPMVKLNVGQHVSVEWEGTWWQGVKVEIVDASLVHVVFTCNQRREAIYRGSTRLLPLHRQMQMQKRRAAAAAAGSNQHISRRNHGSGRQIEFTRNDDEHFGSVKSGDSSSAQPKKSNTARKSTAASRRDNDLRTNKPDIINRTVWESKGSVKPLTVHCAEGMKFVKHQCSALCLDDPKYIYDEDKQVTKDEKLKHFSPLLIPIILGWKRLLTKHKNLGRRSIHYVAPCGRRLRNLEEVHRYLRVTHSTLEIDFFNFEWYVHVFNYFTPERQFYKIDDISYGKENVPVSCVNSLDNNYPEYVEYSTIRLPQTNVKIPLDEGFLTCCDCEDDCQDKDKCSCWQLTIQSTAASDPDAQIDPNVGYEYRRLMNHVSTGIYECNKFCKCNKTCLNRVAQNPIRLPLQVFKTDRRGWGIRSLADIPAGGFICIYVGNLYTNEEANKQGQDFGDEYFAELDLIEVIESRKEGYEDDYEGEEGDVEVLHDDRNYKPNSESSDEDMDMGRSFGMGHLALGTNSETDRQTRNKKKVDDIDNNKEKPKYVSTRKYFHKDEDHYVMDAKSIGNIGRYLNASCSPNVFVQNCFVDTHDLRFPWVAFFASSHISAGDELCWDYNYQVDQVPGKEIYCQCGADNCRGRLL